MYYYKILTGYLIYEIIVLVQHFMIISCMSLLKYPRFYRVLQLLLLNSCFPDFGGNISFKLFLTLLIGWDVVICDDQCASLSSKFSSYILTVTLSAWNLDRSQRVPCYVSKDIRILCDSFGPAADSWAASPDKSAEPVGWRNFVYSTNFCTRHTVAPRLGEHSFDYSLLVTVKVWNIILQIQCIQYAKNVVPKI